MAFDEIGFLIERGKSWIAAERTVRRPRAQPLPDQLRRRFGPYFPAGVVDTARMQFGPQIPNPPFYAELAAAGQPMPIDFTQMWGITFIDTILIAQSKVTPEALEPLLFHECVHIMQYDILGADRFVEQYVTGWALNGRVYERIPLEAEAYQLQSTYTAHPGVTFSVEAAVRGRLHL